MGNNLVVSKGAFTSEDIPFQLPRYRRSQNTDSWTIYDTDSPIDQDNVLKRLNELQETKDALEMLLNYVCHSAGLPTIDTEGVIAWVDSISELYGSSIDRLKGDAARFTQESEVADDEFVKGLNIGKAEQTLKICEALEKRNPYLLGNDF